MRNVVPEMTTWLPSMEKVNPPAVSVTIGACVMLAAATVVDGIATPKELMVIFCPDDNVRVVAGMPAPNL